MSPNDHILKALGRLDTRYTVRYTLPMDPIDPTIPAPNSILLRPDGSGITTGEKTARKTFKILARHHEALEQGKYKNNGGVLVRILLRMYFDDKIPIAKIEFNRLYDEHQSRS